MSEILVIGAGIGGLSAAVELAARGARVRVLEAGSGPGGKAGVTVLEGVEVDTGPSVLTLPEVFDGVFSRAGTSLAEQVELLEPDPAFRYHYPDGTVLDVRPSVSDTLEGVRASLGADAAKELEGFLGYAEQIWDAGAPNFVFGPAPTASTLLRLGITHIGALSRIDSTRTMLRAIEGRVKSEPLRWLLTRYATYNGSDPRVAPATLNCIAHVELGRGGFGVRGGIYELVRALVRVAEGLGVDFEYGRQVHRIALEAGRVVGVETDEGLVPARAVVANADAAHLRRDLLPREAGRHIPEAPVSMSGYNAIFRARSTQQPRPAHAVLFPKDYLAEFEDIFDQDLPPRDPTVYLCAQAVCHGRARWPDAEPLFVMANAPAEPEYGERPFGTYETLGAVVRDRLVQAGLLAADDRELWRRTPRELAARFLGSRGALYGAASNGMMSAFRRPANRLSRVPGLYLASGSAHPGGGLPLCAQSGRMAAEHVADDFGLPALASRRPA